MGPGEHFLSASKYIDIPNILIALRSFFSRLCVDICHGYSVHEELGFLLLLAHERRLALTEELLAWSVSNRG